MRRLRFRGGASRRGLGYSDPTPGSGPLEEEAYRSGFDLPRCRFGALSFKNANGGENGKFHLLSVVEERRAAKWLARSAKASNQGSRADFSVAYPGLKD